MVDSGLPRRKQPHIRRHRTDLSPSHFCPSLAQRRPVSAPVLQLYIRFAGDDFAIILERKIRATTIPQMSTAGASGAASVNVQFMRPDAVRFPDGKLYSRRDEALRRRVLDVVDRCRLKNHVYVSDCFIRCLGCQNGGERCVSSKTLSGIQV
jgi:hypothetical protein